MTNPIRTAVLPLKQAAQDRAEVEARKLIARMHAKLEAAQWDLNDAAPRPGSWDRDYQEKMAVVARYNAVTSSYREDYMPRAPRPVYIDEQKVERFVLDAREDAAAQYEAFIAKLEGKIGETLSAVLTGNHVWGYSFLTVQTAEGQQTWKTQMIVNCSKLGKLFNQFPTRKVKKGGRA